MDKKWILPTKVDLTIVEKFVAELQLPVPLATLLAERGYDSVERARSFLKPRLSALRPPEEIPNISQAVDRLQEALTKKEKIILYGDYDVDGITSLAFLCRALRALGGDVDCFIPDRSSEGYGLSQEGLACCFQMFQPSLIVAVDCGTNSLEEAQWIKARHVDLIVLDHHEIQDPDQLPPILVNPKLLPLSNRDVLKKSAIAERRLDVRLDSPGDLESLYESSPSQVPSCSSLAETLSISPHDQDGRLGSDYHYLCSVGLVFKCVHALLKRYTARPLDLRPYLDLVALGTVADIVPLMEENRIFVFHGLRELAHSRWPGIAALIKVAKIEPPFTTEDIGFKLGPRLNAAGRLASALEALALLLTDDPIEAEHLARHLDMRNRERQGIERAVREEAEEIVAADFALAPSKSIVLGRPHWHPGVVGIVASRISKRWHRPTLIIGFDEHGLGKGSGRSIHGFSLVSALETCAHLLEAFGGHEMAAGLTVEEANLEMLRATFEETAEALLSKEELIPRLQLHAEVNITDLSLSWLGDQDRLGPFGVGNAQPLLIARALYPWREPRVLKEKHLRLEFLGENNMPLAGIFFNGALEPLPRPPWDIAFTLARNTYQGKTSLQLQIVAIRKASQP